MSWLWDWIAPTFDYLFHTWQWGDVPGWIESLATGAAFLIVAITLAMQLKDRRSEQAGNVDYIVWAAEPSPPVFATQAVPFAPGTPKEWPRRVLGQEAGKYAQLYVTVFNSSKNAVNDVLVSAPFATAKTVSVGKIPPGEHTCRYEKIDPDATGKPAVSPAVLIPVIQFRDQNGRLWQRDARGELTPIRKKRHELPKPKRTAQLNP